MTMPTPTTALAEVQKLYRTLLKDGYTGSYTCGLIHNLEHLIESEARAHQEEVERLNLGNTLEHARVLDLERQRDNANLVAETAGKELKRNVEQGYAREAVLKNERDTAQAFARYNTNATNRVRQVVREWTNKWNDGYKIFSPNIHHFDLDALEKAVEAAAQPLADEAVGNAGVTRVKYEQAVDEMQEHIRHLGIRKHAERLLDALIAAVREAQ